MATFTDQITELERWIGTGQYGLEAPSDISAGHTPYSSTDDLPRERGRALLTSIVAAEILPRLARLRRNRAATGAGPDVTTADDTRELVNLLLHQEASGAVLFTDRLRLRGATPASLYLGAMTQAARALGDLWDQDRCDFAQVTISMGRLQQLLRALSPHFQLDAVSQLQPERVLLVPAPGEQHTFGLLMLAEFFKREGWHVAGGPATSAKDAVLIVRDAWIDIAGFSIGSVARLEALAQCIRAVRRASRNPNLYVMVGGPLFLSKPELVTRTGADAAADDAAGAVRQANELMGMKAAAD